MFKKIIPAIVLLLCLSLTYGFGQGQRKKDEQIRKLKIEFVTQQMHLDPQQIQKFTPVYNRYADELLVQKFAIKDLEKNPDSHYQIEERQRLEEKMVEIKGRYKNDFLKIISPEQLASMYKAEADFKTVLLNYLKNKKE